MTRISFLSLYGFRPIPGHPEPRQVSVHLCFAALQVPKSVLFPLAPLPFGALQVGSNPRMDGIQSELPHQEAAA